jgi:hypothetical protein
MGGLITKSTAITISVLQRSGEPAKMWANPAVHAAILHEKGRYGAQCVTAARATWRRTSTYDCA